METLKTIESILIANRGEIASRVIRTCRQMGIRTIAVFSDADANLPYVGEADIAVYIGPSEPAKSYLDQDKIIMVAQKHHADAIHPGYGFLSENASFAQRCIDEGIIFIGPNPTAVWAMGSKSDAKDLMIKHKVPVIPGYRGDDQSTDRLIEEAKKIGYPLLLKATAGGGGKGMRIVHHENELESAISSAKREALKAFGDDRMIIEKYISKGRHIEFQIFGDKHGNVIHILERECSIQRRYQKVIEESPSPVMTAELRSAMGQSAVAAAHALHYDNAGTVEFLYDNGQYYFLEVNTRLQVEHPVTEMITGLDLVKMQIESAQGLPLRVKQEDIIGRGYSVEARLYAEDPANNFLPVSGKILEWSVPEVNGLRIESAVKSMTDVSIYYDPMIAKLIIWDEDRNTALRKLRYTLRNLRCLGIKTNQNFLLKLLNHEQFILGNYSTDFIDSHIGELTEYSPSDEELHKALIASTIYGWLRRKSHQKLLKGIPSGWRNNFYERIKHTFINDEIEHVVEYRFKEEEFHILIDSIEYKASFIESSNEGIVIQINGQRSAFILRQIDNDYYTFNEELGQLKVTRKEKFPDPTAKESKDLYVAPMPSQVIKVLVKIDAEVQAGDALVILSSMKMENTITANTNGIVTAIYVEENTNITAGQILLKIDE